jgi:CRISPR-associated protein Cas2
VDDRLRDKVVKHLKGLGVRVQKSVFECPELSEKQFLKLKDILEGTIDHTQDSIRYYRLCKACLTLVEFSGVGDKPFTGRCGFF